MSEAKQDYLYRASGCCILTNATVFTLFHDEGRFRMRNSQRSSCVYSNSRNDVPRVAQWYGTIAAHTRHRASVLVVFVMFCVHMHSFAGLIRRTPLPTFSDTAITDRHSDTTIFQLRAHWVRISWSIGSEKSFRHVPPVGVEPSTPCMQGEHPIH